MGVVARLQVLSVEHWINAKVVKMQPVLSSEDPHDEEIKAFFAATPAGSVALTFPLDERDDLKSGVQQYLFLESTRQDDSYPHEFEVKMIQLEGWATKVMLKAQSTAETNWNSSTMEFTIKNEAASEQFQVGGKFYVRLEAVNAS